jgi:hypothetical protein
MKELAAALGLSPRYVRRLVERGMPMDIEAAKQWRAQNVEQRVRLAATDDALADLTAEDFQTLCAIEGAFLDLPVVLRRHGLEENRITKIMATAFTSVEQQLRARGMNKTATAAAVHILQELARR